MNHLEKNKLKKFQGLLRKSTVPKKIASSARTAYTRLGKRFNLKKALGNLRSKDTPKTAQDNSNIFTDKESEQNFNQSTRAEQILKDGKIEIHGSRCLSRNTVEDCSIKPNHNETEKKEERTIEPKQTDSSETSSGCHHHLGYLGKQDSKTTIPDECMTCKDLLKCTQKRN